MPRLSSIRKPICGCRSSTSRSGVCQRTGLAQDLLRDRELAEVVQAAGRRVSSICSWSSPRRARPSRRARRPVPNGYRCTCREGRRPWRGSPRRGSALRGRPVREAAQLGELDDVGAVDVRAVLAVLLGPVEGAVGQTDELDAARRLGREGRDAGADGDRADVVELERGDAVDDRRSATRPPPPRPLRAAARTRRRRDGRPRRSGAARRDLGEHPVTRGVPNRSLTRLKSSTSIRQRLNVLRAAPRRQLALDALVEVAMVAKSRQRIGQRERIARRRGRSSAGRARSRAAGRRGRPTGAATAARGRRASARPTPSARRPRSSSEGSPGSARGTRPPRR